MFTTRVNDGQQTTVADNAFCQAPPFGCAQEGNPANQKGGVMEQGGEPQTANPVEAVAVPGTAGTTARPDLTSAAIVQSGGNPTNQVDYTFNQPITTGNASQFTVTLSNGQEIQGDSESVISSNTVRVTFSTANLQNFQELAVKASAYAAFPLSAVHGVNLVGGAHPDNTVGGVAIGDNAGAFAAGYTSGPDFRSVTFNTSTGQVVLQADQRIDPATVFAGGPSGPCRGGAAPPCPYWSLLANDGTVITSTPQNAAGVLSAPYQSQVVLTFFPTDLARAVAIQVSGFPFFGCGNDSGVFGTPAVFTYGGGGFAAQGSDCQVIAPTASGAAFRDPYKGKVKVRWHYLSKQQTAQGLRHHRRHRR